MQPSSPAPWSRQANRIQIHRSSVRRMTHDAPLPAELRCWVNRLLPELGTATDVSWDRGCSRVWHLVAEPTEAYVKLSPTEADYQREVHAYQHADQFAPHEVPRLLATDPDLRAIMTSPVPGLVVRGLELIAEVETQVHTLAGRLLRRWHELPERITDRARQAIRECVAEQAREAAISLEHCTEQLTAAHQALVRRVARELPRLAADLPHAYRHGDYSPRNWLWDAQKTACGLIDFEDAAPGIAVEDCVWLYGAAWPTRPDLREAFLAGYGRDLTDDEQTALSLFTASVAISYLSTGLTKQEPVLIDRGRTVLDHLVATTG